MLSTSMKSFDTIGLDLSLTNTGVALLQVPPADLGANCFVTSRNIPGKLRGGARLIQMRDALARLLEQRRTNVPVYAAIEGYAMGGSGRITGLAEWGGVVRVLLTEMQIPILCVPPSSLKLWTAGHGFADKGQMRVAVRRMNEGRLRTVWLNPNGNAPTDDEVDAVALAQFMRARVLLEAGTPLPVDGEKARKSLATPKWETSAGASIIRGGPARKRGVEK